MRPSKRKALVTLVTGCVLSTTLGVLAFPKLKYYEQPATGNDQPGGIRAGGGGLYGTGCAQDWGVKCSHCHINDNLQQGMITALIDVYPPFVDVNGEEGYVPGERYTFTFDLAGEHLINAENVNGIAVAIEDASGATAGDYFADSGVDSIGCMSAPPADNDPTLMTTYVYGRCHAVLGTGKANAVSWTFDWQAPAAGGGELTLFYGIVDGDSAGDASLGDDVVEGTRKLQEGS